VNAQRRAFLAVGAAAPVAGGIAALDAPKQRAWSDVPPREVIRKQYFPDVVLRTHEGRSVRLYEDLIRDKIVTINYMYVACSDGTCPITTHNLTRVQKLLKERVGRDIFMYSITLDPEIDTPEALGKYARMHGVGPGWLFLTPAPRDAEMLRRRLGYYDLNPEVDKLRSSHAAMLRFGNERRQLWGTASGIADPEVIVRSIRWVTDPPEAARRRVGAASIAF
jgi:protein SCO1/2